MTSRSVLTLTVESLQGSCDLIFEAERLACCGWVGRDRTALQAHIDELSRLGVAPPARVPIYMDLSPYLITSDDEIDVVSASTSGEVEYVLLRRDREMWVTVGSDQTDRDIETRSIVASKQMCPKYLARRCWPYGELQDHWDRLELRSWVMRDGHRTLYQQSSLASILGPDALMAGVRESPSPPSASMVLFSGTVPTTAGLVYGDAYELELRDPVMRRTIAGAYRVRVLPQLI
jgi:hypothetical protein